LHRLYQRCIRVESEISACDFNLPNRGMVRVNDKINSIIGLTPRTISSVATAPDVTLGFDPAPSVWAESWLFQVGETLRSTGFEESERLISTQPCPTCDTVTRVVYVQHSAIA
jgi:hypothetical protein